MRTRIYILIASRYLLTIVGLLVAPSAHAVMLGPGVGLSAGGGTVVSGDSGTRLNIAGYGNQFMSLVGGTYNVSDFEFQMGGATSGSVTPFLATLSSSSPLTYDTIWLGDAVNGVGSVGSNRTTNYAAGSQQFTLGGTTSIAAGFFTSNNADLVRYVTPSNGGGTVQDAAFITTPSMVGDSISLFSHPNANQSYRFEINVSPLVMGGGDIIVNNVAELRAAGTLNDANIIMAPGEYWIDQNGNDPTLVPLVGNNTTYDFSQATFKVDTRNFDGLGTGHANTVNVFGFYGDGSTLSGLDLEAVHVDVDTDPNAQRWSDSPATNMLRIGGSDNRLENSTIIARGSSTYGYGDAFGKGDSPCSGCANITNRKGLGIQIRNASGTTEIDGLDLQMHSMGHGVYVQGTSGLVDIRNTTVTGELADSQDIIDHPVYQATITEEYPDGRTHFGPAMWEGIKISKSEDGIRFYGTSSADFYGENVVVENMREAFSLFSTTGTATVVNSEAWNNETGFEPGSGDVILNSRASATNGPVIYMRQDSISDVVAEIELSGDQPQPGRDWNIAIISGYSNEITLTQGDITPGVLSSQSRVRVAQRYNDWRHNPGLPDASIDNGRTTRDLSIINTTGQDLMLGTASLEGSYNYEITAGAVLGGFGRVFTAQTNNSVDIKLMSGGALDPIGTLRFEVGDGELELWPGINGSNTNALLFELGPSGQSDRIEAFGSSDLDIGTGVLNFDDFVFTASNDFNGGEFTLFLSDHAITGSLGSNLAGLVNGLDAVLSLGPGGRSVMLSVEIAVALPGDYNDDGLVDAADYTVWRDNFDGSSLPNETASPGVVDLADFDVWVAHFGESLPGSTSSIPEPASIGLLLTVMSTAISLRRRPTDSSSCGSQRD